jgi:hypothetical protein
MLLSLSVPTADPFAAKALLIGYALGCLSGSYVGYCTAWFSMRCGLVAWHEFRRWRRLRKLRQPRRRDRRGRWS